VTANACRHDCKSGGLTLSCALSAAYAPREPATSRNFLHMSTAQPRTASDGVSQRQLMRRAATVGLLMRNTVNLVVALVWLADPGSQAQPMGKWLLGALAVWSLYRVTTRSHRTIFTAADYMFVLAICAAIPVLLRDPHFYAYNTVPQAIAGTAVVSFSVVLPARVSLPMTAVVAITYANGAAAVAGWEHVGDIAAVFYFGLQWATAALIRIMLLRVAAAVDRARNPRQAAELNQQVTDAVREFEREQLSLLHDTAASTLLMVGQGTSLPPQRLAAQARRDLELLDEGPWVAPPPQIELVAALQQCAGHLSTSVRFTGREEVWLNGETAKAVIAAAREAMNNVDRHADATSLTVTVSADAVVFEDDGVGFDPDNPRSGHGIADSIIGRMRRAGGSAVIHSVPGSGTATELSWGRESSGAAAAPGVIDPDRLIERIRVRYGLALTAYAVANLAATIPYAVMRAENVAAHVALGVAAVASTLTAIPGIRRGHWRSAWVACAVLLVVTIVQPWLLPVDNLGGQAHWAQGAIGWCVLPLVLGLPTRTGAGVLVFYWVVGAMVEVVRSPSAPTLVNVGLGTASILGVQLFALMFNGLMRDAAADVQAETEAHQRLIRRDRVGQALRAEYQRRYAKLVDNVVPLLAALSHGSTVDDSLQRRARAESRRLRTLFDQATTFDNPLMQEVRPILDAAEARQVDVVVHVAGDLPDLSAADISSLVRPLARVLEATTTSARVVVSAISEEVSVSIVCRGSPSVSVLPETIEGDDVDVVTSDDSVWFLIRCRLQREAATMSSPVNFVAP
jgi:hypothetical protein